MSLFAQEQLGPTVREHPARYTGAPIPVLVSMLRGATRILDPFAGTGQNQLKRVAAVAQARCLTPYERTRGNNVREVVAIVEVTLAQRPTQLTLLPGGGQ